MRILLTQPWSIQENLGQAYNKAIESAGPDYDLVALMDYDAMLTTPRWYEQLQGAWRDATIGVLGAVTNRIGNKAQVPENAPKDHDIRAHRQFGHYLAEKYGSETLDITDDYFEGRGDLLGGVLMATSPGIWERVGGFPDQQGKLGIDNAYHRRIREAKLRVHILRGLYVYHWYRA